MTAIEKVISVAKKEIGYLEKASGSQLYDKTSNAGSANYTKYGYEMHKLYPATMDYPAAWCDCFVDWCFVQAFGANVAAKMLHKFDDYTVNSAGYYKNNGEWHTTPKIGDQIFFKNNNGGICHTGIVYYVDNSYVYTIEGNTSSASGVVANGGCVRDKKYSRNYKLIAGYGRPNYGLYKEEDEEMTAEEKTKFNALVNAVSNLTVKVDNLTAIINSLTGKMIYAWVDDNMPEWARPTIQKLMDKGYLKGDEEGKLNLNDEMLRTFVILDRAGAFGE